jgi:D-alanyl-D-alanine carboxypeptidase/D-alanyl-D-alanine-endopeptidase (penicillin-binding protein 4)
VRAGTERLEEPDVRYYRFKDSNEIRARGRLPLNTEIYDFAAIHDPARYVSALLFERLEAHGVDIEGAPVSAHMFGTSVELTTGTQVLDRVQSPPLSDLLKVANTENVNLYAEVLLREFALKRGFPASFSGGAEAVVDWLAQRRLQRTGFLMVDGSGLSAVNQVTPRLLTNVLTEIGRSPNEGVYKNSLAAPGEGTLEGRFTASPLLVDFRAKTGALAGVQGLAGYMTIGEKEYAFAFLLNGFAPGRAQEAQTLIDAIILELAASPLLR